MLGAEIAFAFHGPLIKRDAEIFERKRMKQIWLAILQRCNNHRSQVYRHYGGRGIKCTIPSFAEFYEHMGERPTTGHSVDRIDVNGDYAIGNLRWATWREQATNTTRTAFVEIDGQKHKRVDLADKYGISPDKIDYRVSKGQSFESVIGKERRYNTASLPLAVAAAAASRRGKPVPWLIGKQKKKEKCRAGLHLLVEGNLHMQPDGSRKCRACALDKRRKRYDEQKEKGEL